MIKPISSTSILLFAILPISLLICDVNCMKPAADGHQHAGQGSESINASNDEFIFKPYYPSKVPNYHAKVDEENVNTFTVKVSNPIIKSTTRFIISPEKKIQYFELMVLEKNRRFKEPFKFELNGKKIDRKYAGQSFSYKPKANINASYGCGLFNHDKKFFYFYTKNNQILLVRDITTKFPMFEGGFSLKVYLFGEGTKVKIHKGTPPSVEELEKEIAKGTPATVEEI